MMVWCGEKEECQCVVIHSIPGMLMWSVCELLLLSGWKEGWFGGKWLREREERVENQKHKSNCNSKKTTTHFD